MEEDVNKDSVHVRVDFQEKDEEEEEERTQNTGGSKSFNQVNQSSKHGFCGCSCIRRYFQQPTIAFYTRYILIFSFILQFVVCFEISSWPYAIALLLMIAIFTHYFWKAGCPRATTLQVTTFAFLSTNIFCESMQSAWIVKPFATIISNLFVYTFFLPGAFDFVFSRYYLVLITAVSELYGLMHMYSQLFRGCPLRPLDFMVINSALKIRSEYSLIQPRGVVAICLALVNLGFIFRFAFCSNTKLNSRPTKIKTIVAWVILFLFLHVAYGLPIKYLEKMGLICKWKIARLYRSAGCFLGFLADYKCFNIKIVPPGYNKAEAANILSQFAPNVTVDKTKLRRPHIIAIMDESFADFGILGDLRLSQDFMPFIRSLKNNTIKGHAAISAYAGFSCNSEYEFLTGNNMGFYSYGTAAYVGVINNKQESMSYLMNKMGYNTISCAATYKDVWNIGTTYKILGFNESFFQGDFYDNSPDWFHRGSSDRRVFKGVIDLYKKRHKDKPLFFFITTIQNHGEYGKTDHPTVVADGYEDIYEISTFLSKLKATDDAVKDLLEYFSNVEDDVVVVFYGDHFPHIDRFVKRFLGKSKDRLPLRLKSLMHMTPFFIWANYDIPEEENVNTTVSYLSGIVMDVAGFPRTAYQNFLQDTRKHIPIITPFSFSDGKKWYSRGDTGNLSQYLTRYSYLQYYMINDRP